MAYTKFATEKAFVKSFTISLREQLRPTNISVVEISPPMVESDLHRDHGNPDKFKCVSSDSHIGGKGLNELLTGVQEIKLTPRPHARRMDRRGGERLGCRCRGNRCWVLTGCH